MKLLFSVPSGYHLRELVMPLRELLDQDSQIEKVFCVTPGAPYAHELFSSYSDKFTFLANASSAEEQVSELNTLRPDVVITNTVGHDARDYPILQAAQRLHIPTVTFIASWDNVWKIERLMHEKKNIAIASHVIVWNAMMKEHFLRIFPDVASEQVSVIGAPRLDYFWRQTRIPNKEELYKSLGLDDITKPLVHIATTELYPMDYIVKAVSDAMQSGDLPSMYIYASVHPGGNLERHKGLERYGAKVNYSFGRQEHASLNEFLYNPSEDDAYRLCALFKHASVLINHSSSTALESLVAGTPVINIQYGKPFDWWNWYRSMVYRDFQQHYKDLTADGATYLVKNKKQLLNATREALDRPVGKGEARKKTIERMITTTDGTASQKVLSVIKQQTTL